MTMTSRPLMFVRRCGCAALAALILLFGLGPAPVRAEPGRQMDVTMDMIVQAWKANAERTAAAEISWEERRFIRRGGVFPVDDIDNPLGEPIPEDDMTVSRTHTFTFDGLQASYSGKGLEWNPHRLEFTEQRRRYVWDGERGMTFRPDEGYPRGEVWEYNHDVFQRWLAPIRLAFRPLAQDWRGVDPAHLVIPESDTSVINGRECFRLETSSERLRAVAAEGRIPRKHVFWVSPELGWRIVAFVESVRHVRTGQYMKTTEVNISYSRTDDGKPYPAQWTVARHRNSDPVEILDATVTHASLKPDIPPSTFRFAFPPRTMVYDYVEGETYVVRDDGTPRILTVAEVLSWTGYEGLMASEPSAGLHAWPLWILLLLLAAIALTMLVRRTVWLRPSQ